MTLEAPALPSLAARAQLGDGRALELLLRALCPVLGAHIRFVMRGEDEADDALQETLWIIARRLGTLENTQWVRAWAYRIATREAVRAARRERRDVALGDDLADVADAALREHPPESPRLDADELTVLEARLDALPHGAQVALRLRYLHELSQDEVAAALELPLGTVKSRVARALEQLRAEFLQQ